MLDGAGRHCKCLAPRRRLNRLKIQGVGHAWADESFDLRDDLGVESFFQPFFFGDLLRARLGGVQFRVGPLFAGLPVGLHVLAKVLLSLDLLPEHIGLGCRDKARPGSSANRSYDTGVRAVPGPRGRPRTHNLAYCT